MPAANPSHYFERLHRLVSERGGIVLSKTYRNDYEKLRFRCAEGHVWMAAPGKIYMGRWCPRCGLDRRAAARRAPAERRFHDLLRERGGVLLSGRYLNSTTRHRLRCREGHEWNAWPQSLVNGAWCPTCTRTRRIEEIRKRYRAPALARLERIARKHRGAAIPESYVNGRQRMAFRCEQGHRFERLPSRVVDGAWCPECASLDRLQRARGAADARGGRCLATRCATVNEPLAWQCHEGHRFRRTLSEALNGSWCPRCRLAARHTIEECRQIARQRGGVCLSERYINEATPLRWRCGEGHAWRARAGALFRGTWCRRCSRGFGRSRARLSLELMREIAAERGGRCLSNQYNGIYDRLRWRCARGHEWETIANNVRRGGWCPNCGRAKKSTLPRMRLLAARRGGECLTRTWIDRSQPLTFRCAHGHRFAERANLVNAGVWCPVCRPRPIASR